MRKRIRKRISKLKSKKVFVFLMVSIVLLSATVLPASALSAEFSATADYSTLKVGDVFKVRVTVNNIQTEEGLILAQFKLYFDSTCLRLVEWNTNKPEAWGDGFEEIAAPKPSEDNPDELYLYVAFMYSEKETGKGITEDGILYTDITFEVLSEAADGTVLRIDDTDVMDDGNQFVSCNTLEIKINFDGAEITNVDIAKEKKINNIVLKTAIGVIAVLIVVVGAVFIGRHIKKSV